MNAFRTKTIHFFLLPVAWYVNRFKQMGGLNHHCKSDYANKVDQKCKNNFDADQYPPAAKLIRI